DAARIARRLQPWSGEPWRVLGEAQLARGSLDAARRSFVRGLDRDARNWELWLDLALASNGAARERALARVEALNPLSPELAEVRSRAER
ncbi:MAG: hypothetical protein M3310_05460, partial [Actinomycetota bacterium]|nr:hypothetical protein [Actinomycetota bacterium]